MHLAPHGKQRCRCLTNGAWGLAATCSDEGQVTKSLKLTPIKDSQGYFLNLAISDKAHKDAKYSTMLSMAEARVMRRLMDVSWRPPACLPHHLPTWVAGWHAGARGCAKQKQLEQAM